MAATVVVDEVAVVAVPSCGCGTVVAVALAVAVALSAPVVTYAGCSVVHAAPKKYENVQISWQRNGLVGLAGEEEPKATY